MTRCHIEHPCLNCGTKFKVQMTVEVVPQWIEFYCNNCDHPVLVEVVKGGDLGNRIKNSINKSN